MATFIPDLNSSDIAFDSERLVFEALRSLPEGWVVLHSFPWLRPERSLSVAPLREGEADFVLLHRKRGLLVLEVKGGRPQLKGRTWSRDGRAMRDPFEQARRNRYALLDAVEERTARRINRGMFAHGDLIVFPHAIYEGQLPLNASPQTFIDSRSLGSISDKVDEAFAAWTRQATDLSSEQFVSLLDALMPKLRLLRSASSEIRAERIRLVQITLDQQATLVGLLANDRVLIEGSAGAGKTLLAVEFALQLAAKGQRVLFLCFNRALAAWLQENTAFDSRAGTSGTLEIATFHSYALSLAKTAGVEFKVPSSNQQTFWDDEVPLILEQAMEVLRTRGQLFQFDAVVVDEAQDFSPDWWVTVESLTRDGKTGRLYVFLDMQQSLRTKPHLPTVALPVRFRLTTNCRNTRAIARSAAVLCATAITLLPSSPEGESPAIRRASSSAEGSGLVIHEVQQLLRHGITASQIVIIGPSSHSRGSLARFSNIDDVRIVEDAADWRRGLGVLVTTSRSFKGLEADVVIIYDFDGFGPFFTRTDLYVAWTRARHRLIVVCTGPEARQTAEAALAEQDGGNLRP